MYKLQKVGIESLNILTHLMKTTFIQAYEDIHTKENIEAYCSENFTNKIATNILSTHMYTCIIAFKQNVPLGFFILKDKECPYKLNHTSLELQQLYILKAEYNTGLGKRLFLHAMKIAQNSSKKYLWLCVSNTNNRALCFYKKMGFEKTGVGKDLRIGTHKLSSSIMTYQL